MNPLSSHIPFDGIRNLIKNPKDNHALIFVWNNPALINICIHLARNLKSIGIEPILINYHSANTEPIFKAGFHHEPLMWHMNESASDINRWINEQNVQQIKDWSYRDVNLHEITEFERAALRAGYDPTLKVRNETELIIKAAFCFEAFHQLLERYKPRACFIWNGLILPQLALKRLCSDRNIVCASLERGLLPEMLVVDPIGINYGSSLGGERWDKMDKSITTIDISLVEDYISRFRSEKKSIVNQQNIINAEKLLHDYDIPLGKKLILIVMQIDKDTNIHYYSPNYKTNKEVISDVVSATGELEDAFILVKTHPESPSTNAKEIQEILGESGRIISDCAIHPLIEISDIVVVRNSTVGLEALLYDKPVICLGQSAYSHKGFTYDVEDKTQLLITLRNILGASDPRTPNPERFKRFLYYLLNNYHYRLKNDDDANRYNRNFLRAVLQNKQENDSQQNKDDESYQTKVTPEQREALKAFREAHRIFEAYQFDQAVERMNYYRNNINYDDFEREDRRLNLIPSVSVIVVAYQTNQLLLDCIDSLLKQDDSDFEILLVDNGGNDEVHEILQNYKLLHIRCPINLVLAEGRNVGAFFARGRILAFLDDDALVNDGYIASIKKAFNNYDIAGFRGKVLPKTQNPNNLKALHYDYGDVPFPATVDTEGNSAFLRQTYIEMNGQDPLLFGFEGTDLSYRIAVKNNQVRTIYWHGTFIYHDYAFSNDKLNTKNTRHERAKSYLIWKHNGVKEWLKSLSKHRKSDASKLNAERLIPRMEIETTNRIKIHNSITADPIDNAVALADRGMLRAARAQLERLCQDPIYAEKACIALNLLPDIPTQTAKIQMSNQPHLKPDLNSEKLVSDEYRFIWAGVPKAATRSILTALYRKPDTGLGCRMVNDELWELLKSNGSYKDYYKFTFVRNPWARIVSCYKDKILAPKEKYINEVIDKIPDLTQGMTFEAFVQFLMDSPYGRDEGADRHWASQHRFVEDPKGTVLVDAIGKTENIQEDFDYISKHIGLPSLKLPWLNTHIGWNPGQEKLIEKDPFYYRDYYTPKTREIVRQRYYIDIGKFDYEF